MHHKNDWDFTYKTKQRSINKMASINGITVYNDDSISSIEAFTLWYMENVDADYDADYDEAEDFVDLKSWCQENGHYIADDKVVNLYDADISNRDIFKLMDEDFYDFGSNSYINYILEGYASSTDLPEISVYLECEFGFLDEDEIMTIEEMIYDRIRAKLLWDIRRGKREMGKFGK